MRLCCRANSVCRAGRLWSLSVIVASVLLAMIGGFGLSVLPAYLMSADDIEFTEAARASTLDALNENSIYAKLAAGGWRSDVFVCYSNPQMFDGGRGIKSAYARLYMDALDWDEPAVTRDSILGDAGLEQMFEAEQLRSSSIYGNPVGLMRMESGWPFRGVRCTLRYDSSLRKWVPLGAYSAIGVGVRDGFVAEYLSSDVYLPLRPNLLGFLLNSAAVWTVGFISSCMLGVLLRARRRTRGICEVCGYDLRGLSHIGCPECGWNRSA